MMTLRLYDFWRSSAAYRVRIALGLKGLAYEAIPTSLADNAHFEPEYREKNPQGFVPMLEAGETRITQSLAIIDWLDAHQPEPRLVPADPALRHGVLARAMVIVADIHPLNNLRVLRYLTDRLGLDQPAIDAWYRHWIGEGFGALEAMAPETGLFGGGAPDLVDVCLVPQVANARRFALDMAPYRRLARIDAALQALPAFAAAHPDAVRPAR